MHERLIAKIPAGDHAAEPCALTAVEPRAVIGAKPLSPSELVESCIARIEQVKPAVNAAHHGVGGGTSFGAARALERLFAADPARARPVPDLASLRAAP